MKKVLTAILFAGLTALANAGYADQAHEIDVDGHVAVSSRPLSAEKEQQMEDQRIAEYEQNQESTDEQATELSVLIIPIKTHNLITLASNQINSTAATLSPYHYHWIEDFPQKNVLKIEDGSEWIFDQSEEQRLESWTPGDTIVISPKQQMPWGSNYPYVMSNKTAGTSIDVKLFTGPIAYGTQTSWVIGKDPNLGHIYLINAQGDRTVWEVSATDMSLFQDWKVNDAVIIGENDSYLWWFSAYSNILINVNMNHNVRAKQVSSIPNC